MYNNLFEYVIENDLISQIKAFDKVWYDGLVIN